MLQKFRFPDGFDKQFRRLQKTHFQTIGQRALGRDKSKNGVADIYKGACLSPWGLSDGRPRRIRCVVSTFRSRNTTLRTLSIKLNQVSSPAPSPGKSDTLTIPIRVLPEPDLPGVYLPQGGLMQTTEDADLVVEGLAIVERDGFYEEGEMEGEITPPDLDAVDADEEAAVIGVTWPGEVRQQHASAHPKHSRERYVYVKLPYEVGVDISLAKRAVRGSF